MNQSFTDKLRDLAVELANGDRDEIKISTAVIEGELAGKKSAKTPAAYIRNTMGRVAEVKEAGSISISKKVVEDMDDDNYGATYYSIRITKTKRKRVYTKSEVEAIRNEERRKTAMKILEISPSISNYAPEEYALLARVVSDMQEIIKRNFIGEGE